MRIQLANLSQGYAAATHGRLPVFAGLDVTVEAGSFTVILGESGSGKSTLLHVMAGLLRPSGGQVLADGRPVHGPAPERSILFQQASLLPWLTVRENIAFGCHLRGELAGLSAKVEELIRLIGLEGFGDRYPAELSVGMAQRVCLARALIGEPKALLLDEPFGALDLCNRTRLQAELLAVWKRRRFTAILVTHDIDEALVVGERVLILGGRPATVVAEYAVDLPYPRDVAGQGFFAGRAHLYSLLQAATVGRAHGPEAR